MALTDLKKNSTRSNKPQFTVDEFIADAENYAVGVPQIDSVRKATEDESVSTLSQGPMRHATFTLSQEAIDTLSKLSKDSGMPKSKLIRQLILSLNEQELRTVVKTTKPVVIKKVE